MAIIILCKNCNQSFKSYPSEVARGKKYCSISCASKINKNLKKTFFQKTSFIEKFFLKISKNNHPNNCWIWEGHKNKQGYGRLRSNYKDLLAHRVSWEIFFYDIPDGFWVCHHCDNPSCVNPEHLFLGTSLDNAQDRSEKKRNRNQNGSNHNMAKLNEKIVINIRRQLALGASGYGLAKKYNVSPMAINNIKHYKSWKHV